MSAEGEDAHDCSLRYRESWVFRKLTLHHQNLDVVNWVDVAHAFFDYLGSRRANGGHPVVKVNLCIFDYLPNVLEPLDRPHCSHGITLLRKAR